MHKYVGVINTPHALERLERQVFPLYLATGAVEQDWVIANKGKTGRKGI